MSRSEKLQKGEEEKALSSRHQDRIRDRMRTGTQDQRRIPRAHNAWISFKRVSVRKLSLF